VSNLGSFIGVKWSPLVFKGFSLGIVVVDSLKK
jgi:hypothetical protein